jgi:hypothetical protein
MGKAQYVSYFSHSWLPEHVDLNLLFWDHLWAAGCRLLVDDNEVDNPPYFVCRIEHLIRCSDLFIALIPAPVGGGLSPNIRDTRQVSPFVMFEIALAERIRLPQLIVYDSGCQFEPGTAPRQNARHVIADTRDLGQGRADAIWEVVANWLRTVTSAKSP